MTTINQLNTNNLSNLLVKAFYEEKCDNCKHLMIDHLRAKPRVHEKLVGLFGYKQLPNECVRCGCKEATK